MPLAIQAIPCLSDNYAWLLRDEASGAVALCDPGEAAPVIAALDAAGGRCDLILLTHHHGDHVGGTPALRERWPRIPRSRPGPARSGRNWAIRRPSCSAWTGWTTRRASATGSRPSRNS